MLRSSDRHRPHLRATAAIVVAGFVALLAALGGPDGTDSKARRGDSNGWTAHRLPNGVSHALYALGVVTTPTEQVDHAHLGRLLGHGTHASAMILRARSSGAESATRAAARAERRLRIAAAGPDRAALLRTVVLPPPVA